MRILLADANAEIRSALRLLLEECGAHDVFEATDARHLLEAGARDSLDVVLFDWDLPDRTPGVRRRDAAGPTGSELVDVLRQTCPRCRVIAMSGRPEARHECVSAGCDAFIDRTEPPDALLGLLEREGPAAAGC
jgi:CheY-like chemotaxis protein